MSDDKNQPRLLASSSIMAAGTVVSRLSGFVRSSLLAAALGLGLHADIFSIANTIPNILYVLLAGGVFNAVLVPQLVRAQRFDPDGGAAFTNRVVTLAALFLLVVTVVLVVFAPQVLSIYLDSRYDDPDRAAQLESVITFARYCLPQVFFYGMFVLVGQILNARGSFGPMMWAPIANNVISVAVLVAYLLVFGPARGAEVDGAYTSPQELLLGIGSTVGIVAQLLILLPYLRKVGFTFRPRFDFRNTGLGHTFKLGGWTVLYLAANQVANAVVVRLASSGTSDGGDGSGYTVYSSALLIVLVPHSVITVSLATAVLPQLAAKAAESDFAGLGVILARVLRSTMAVVVPFAVLLPFLARDMLNVIWGHGAAADTFAQHTPTVALFGPGIVFFTIQYLLLRGFYALEQTRTVFFIQCWISLVNIVVAVVLVREFDAAWTAPALVIAYAVSYLVGVAISYVVLHRRLGGLDTPRTLRFTGRIVLVSVVAAIPTAAAAWFLGALTTEPAWPLALLRGGVVCTVGAVAIVLLARRLGLRELTDVLDTVARRLGRARKSAG